MVDIYGKFDEQVQHCKSLGIDIVMDNFNATVQFGRRKAVKYGAFDLGQRNGCSKSLVVWDKEKCLIITRLCFKHYTRNLHIMKIMFMFDRITLISIMINESFQNSVKSVSAYVGVECHADQILLI